MATKNIVPRGNGEGSLGTSLKKWDRVYTNEVILADGESVTNKINAKSTKATTLAGYGITDAYTKTEANSLLGAKADKNDTYNKTQTDNLLGDKANKATTLAGYGIANAYTKTEADSLLGAKANASDTYTKTEVDNSLKNYLPLSGGELTDSLKVRSVDGKTELNAGSLELFYVTPFIDFHFDNNNKDFTSRIIERNEGILSIESSATARSGIIETIISSGTNYIRYASGLQLCWGQTSSYTAGTIVTVTFPQAFSSAPAVTINRKSSATNTDSEGNVVVCDNGTNNFKFVCSKGSNSLWIAIGFWK